MACHFVNEQEVLEYASMTSSHQDDGSDDGSRSENDRQSNQIKNPILLKSESQFSESDISNKIKLPRGGSIVMTKAGAIQFSMVPETLKDSINLGLDVPGIFIVPSHRFDKRFCLSVAEFEFPAYFSFFVKRRRVTLITDKEGEEAIRAIFQETLLGPKDLSRFDQDFSSDYNSKPDIIKELGHFAKNPFNPSEPLTVDLLINFLIFDEQNQVNLGQEVIVKKEDQKFLIFENGKQIAKMKNKVEILIDDAKSNAYIKYGLFSNPNDQQYVEHYFEQTFTPPAFGVTVLGCSHGFDPKGSVSGYIFWINGLGVMLDPPPFTTLLLRKNGIPSRLVKWVIISHNHADHDAGTFQKLLESEKTILISTATIKESFVRKYAAMTGFTADYIQSLFNFERVIVGHPLKINGASFEFHYSLHSIPCLSFTVRLGGKSIYFSGDTFYEPNGLKAIYEKGVISESRFNYLTSEDKWNNSLILHEAGVPPIHTPAKLLALLPPEVKEKLRLIHTAAKDIPPDSGLKVPGVGLENTIVLINQTEDSRLNIIQELSLIENIDLFKHANIHQVRQIFESSTLKKYEQNQNICIQDEIGAEFYIIRKGTVKIHSENPVFVKYLHYGDYFGEGCFFNQNKRRANATAMNQCDLITLSKADFLRVFQYDEVMQKLENLQVVRSQTQIMEKNKFFSQLTSYQKIQLELLLNQKRFFQKHSMIQQYGVMATVAFFVVSGKAQVILPSDYVVQQFEGQSVKVNRQDSTISDQTKQQQQQIIDQKKKRLSLPINLAMLEQQRPNIQTPEVSEKSSISEIKTYPLTSGMFFGEIDSIVQNRRTTTIVEAVEDTEIVILESSSLRSFLADNPGLMVLFQESIIIE
ncbi:unnamed protein product [Paramecium octaurelia]|uniref:Cyclic nucleotide-binding domain-containing protein n=1 Tax=Paramecium octaurelia TaxID=43137 RepID=A0A8S1W0I3_PAROT|nr:unnamed protein product [Paramecium octaurelia]